MIEKKSPTLKTGLAGIIAGESSICTVGLGNGLNYRGYNINELIEGNCTFEEVIYLLVIGTLPTVDNLNKMKIQISKGRNLPKKLVILLEMMGKDTHPMVVLRTVCSFLGALEPET